MKRISLILFIAALPLLLQAQHYVGLSVDATTAWQLDQLDETRPGLGGGAQLGFTYEFQRNMFVLTTGVAASYMTTSQLLDSVHKSFAMTDTRGIPVNYLAHIDQRKDIIQQLHVKLPIMAGLTEGHFYALAGLVFDFSFKGKTVQKAQLYTAGDYGDRYYDILESMDNHGYYDYHAIRTNSTIQFYPDLRISAELGGSFLLGNGQARPKAKIGMFFEYGLTDINREEMNEKLYVYDTTEGLKVTMGNIFSTQLVYGSRINNLEVGIRGTILFNVGGLEGNGGCRCHKRLL